MHLNDQPHWVPSALLDAEVQSRAIDYMDDRYRAIVLKWERRTKEEDAFMGAYMTIRTVLELSSVSKYERLCRLGLLPYARSSAINHTLLSSVDNEWESKK